jgi:hypothetical protein
MLLWGMGSFFIEVILGARGVSRFRLMEGHGGEGVVGSVWSTMKSGLRGTTWGRGAILEFAKGGIHTLHILRELLCEIVGSFYVSRQTDIVAFQGASEFAGHMGKGGLCPGLCLIKLSI